MDEFYSGPQFILLAHLDGPEPSAIVLGADMRLSINHDPPKESEASREGSGGKGTNRGLEQILSGHRVQRNSVDSVPELDTIDCNDPVK
jgi:hypothetical protein